MLQDRHARTGMHADADARDLLHLQDELAANVTLEQGKTLPDARGDVFRGLGARAHLLYLHAWAAGLMHST